MNNRREFFQLGMAAISLPFMSCGCSRLTANPNPLYTSIYDIRYPDSIVFAQESQRLGSRIDGIRDDIMPVLDGGLRERWQKEAVIIAGLTRFPAFYYFDRLASATGHRVLYHAEHVYHADGHVAHKLTAPAWALGEARHALLVGEHWGRSVAHVMRLFSSVDTQLVSVTVETGAPNPSSGIGHLESWLIG